MPPLREMQEDIAGIANAILTRLARGAPARLESDALAALQRYPFPGNVRELENILERGLSLAADPQQHHRGRPAPHALRGRGGRGDAARARNGRCRTTSTASSARRSTRRSRRRATTAPPRRSSSASRFARCATGWSGWASSEPRGSASTGPRRAGAHDLPGRPRPESRERVETSPIIVVGSSSARISARLVRDVLRARLLQALVARARVRLQALLAPA